MVDRARSRGLEFDPDHFLRHDPPDAERRHLGEEVAPDPLGQIHESRKGFYLAFPRFDRKLEAYGAAAASTATLRRKRKSEYRPANLDEYLAAGGHEVPI